MKVCMISNFINHHQKPFCDAFYEKLKDDFSFIATMPMEQERRDMGWQEIDNLPYLFMGYENPQKAESLVMEADMLLAGWVEDPRLIIKRMRANKLTLRMSERIYREGQWKFISPLGLINKYKEHIRFRKGNNALLCCGAYVASDFDLIGAYPGRRYKFGYFPESRKYSSFQELYDKKDKIDKLIIEHPELLPMPPQQISVQEIQILWVGRMMEIKHPEFPIQLASHLSMLGFRFHIHMVGDGKLKPMYEDFARYELADPYITFHGFKTPKEVRDMMEKSHIFLFTSDFIEGWGVVVNEAMNAGCGCVVSKEAGCADYLIEHGINGLVYQNGDYNDFFNQVVSLLNDMENTKKLGEKAYDTIVNLWNADVAVKRIIDYYEGLKSGNISVPETGPMSLAKSIKPGFFKTGKL